MAKIERFLNDFIGVVSLFPILRKKLQTLMPYTTPFLTNTLPITL